MNKLKIEVMSKLMKNVVKSKGTRIIISAFAVILGMVIYLIIYNYKTQLKIHEDKVLSKLSGIAKNVAQQVDGESHKQLLSTHTSKDAITHNEQDSDYAEIYEILKTTQNINQIQSNIYTLVFNPDSETFTFGVSSADVPFYRHQYDSPPSSLLENYSTGGTITPYHDDHGTWLSAFWPIHDDEGKVVAVLQIDEQFDEFIESANEAIIKDIFISSLIFTILLIVVLYFSLRGILQKEEKYSKEIIQSKMTIEQKNTELMDSLLYAKRIQDSILPSKKEILRLLPQSFISFLPRDIVSGDFYWFAEKEDKIIIAAADCTGHGVPGAFMSLIGSILLNEIVHNKGICTPGEILSQLDMDLSEALNKNENRDFVQDGMDIALCSIKKDYSEIQFAGAYNPLIHISNGELSELKANRFPIGGNRTNEKRPFTTHTVKLSAGDALYIFTDGYIDQFGGERGKKFMSKKFKSQLLELYHKDSDRQREDLEETLFEWKRDLEQVDDILVMGIKVPHTYKEKAAA